MEMQGLPSNSQSADASGVVVGAAVWLKNQMIIPPMDQMGINFAGISYAAATVVADAVEDFVHQSWDWGR